MKPIRHHVKDFELEYHIHKDKLPGDFREQAEKFLEFCSFYIDAFEAGCERLIPEMDKLMLRHYPATAQATHPVQLQYIKELHEANLYGHFTQLRNLIKEQLEGLNILEKYPKLEMWRDFYCKPAQPDTVNDGHRNIYLHPNDEDWQKYKEKENRLLKILHEWQENRKQEYYNLVQPLLFEYLPQLHNLEGDFWVLYAVTIRDNYEEWTSCLEHLETAIEYHMPPDSVNWKDEDFRKLLREQRPLYSKEVDAKRDKMIFGSEGKH